MPSRRRAAAVFAAHLAAQLGLLLSLTSPAQAFELGRPQTLSGLGEPLSLKLPLRMNAGETLNPDCIQVHIESGEHRLTAGDVQKTVELHPETQSGTVWLRSSVPIEEPVIKLAIGCPLQHLTAFVDPAQSGPAAHAAVTTTGDLKWAPSAAGIAPAVPASHPAKAQPQAKTPLTLATESGLRLDGQVGLPKRRASLVDNWQHDDSSNRLSLVLRLAQDVGEALLSTPEAVATRLREAEREFNQLQREQRSLDAQVDLLSKQLQQGPTEAPSGLGVVAMLLGWALLLIGAAIYFWRRRQGTQRGVRKVMGKGARRDAAAAL
ncbi:type IV pilus assembly protein FimV [Paucibacter sp. KCTC 42545]|uniref:type IV pilus assembly protein FimV n=1 Tax=Paucibacter sp. KCTC 42545 TaxID=1768242 RepID=UPI0012E3C0DE|nr:hypothetical protein [Paucibacter sp. KCTC 42545]